MKTNIKLSVPGEIFEFGENTAFLCLPENKSDAHLIPWVWYAPVLNTYPNTDEKWMFNKFLTAGIAVAGIGVGESYGNPYGRKVYTKFHQYLLTNHGLSSHPCLLARSRGGLMLLNWACEHPSDVAAVAGIYPVCNILSYPGLEQACSAYSMTAEQLAANLAEHNPIDRIEKLAKRQVPIFIIHGDNDEVVPLEENSGELAKRYERYGAKIQLKLISGGGHTLWDGWFQSEDLVDFIIDHADMLRDY